MALEHLLSGPLLRTGLSFFTIPLAILGGGLLSLSLAAPDPASLPLWELLRFERWGRALLNFGRPLAGGGFGGAIGLFERCVDGRLSVAEDEDARASFSEALGIVDDEEDFVARPKGAGWADSAAVMATLLARDRTSDRVGECIWGEFGVGVCEPDAGFKPSCPVTTVPARDRRPGRLGVGAIECVSVFGVLAPLTILDCESGLEAVAATAWP